MFAKVYQYKFPGLTEAKVAATFCSDYLGKQITKYNFQSLNILIGKEGNLSIFIKLFARNRWESPCATIKVHGDLQERRCPGCAAPRVLCT